jgi:hypothetical protein
VVRLSVLLGGSAMKPRDMTTAQLVKMLRAHASAGGWGPDGPVNSLPIHVSRLMIEAADRLERAARLNNAELGLPDDEWQDVE